MHLLHLFDDFQLEYVHLNHEDKLCVDKYIYVLPSSIKRYKSSALHFLNIMEGVTGSENLKMRKFHQFVKPINVKKPSKFLFHQRRQITINIYINVAGFKEAKRFQKMPSGEKDGKNPTIFVLTRTEFSTIWKVLTQTGFLHKESSQIMSVLSEVAWKVVVTVHICVSGPGTTSSYPGFRHESQVETRLFQVIVAITQQPVATNTKRKKMLRILQLR